MDADIHPDLEISANMLVFFSLCLSAENKELIHIKPVKIQQIYVVKCSFVKPIAKQMTKMHCVYVDLQNQLSDEQKKYFTTKYASEEQLFNVAWERNEM